MAISTEQVKEYIQQYQGQYSKDAIVTELRQTGVDQQTIDAAYAELEGSNDTSQQATTGQQTGSQQEQPSGASSAAAAPQAGGIKRRNPILVIVLGYLTGIYLIVWIILTSMELRKNTKAMVSPKWLIAIFLLPFVSIGVMVSGTVLALFGGSGGGMLTSVLSPILGVLTLAVSLYYLWKYYAALHELTGANNVLLFVLQLIPIANIVGTYLTQQELNKKAE